MNEPTVKQMLEFVFAHEHLEGVLIESASCSELATAVVMNFGGRVVGYWNWDNPGATAAPDCDGHDFALLGDRYIVDIWVRDVAHTSERAVFDLADADDRRRAYELYGEPGAWKEVLSAPEELMDVLPTRDRLARTGR